MTINKKSKSSQKKVLVKKKVINFTRLFDQDKDYGQLKQPTIDDSIDKGPVFLVVVFSIFMIFSIIFIFYNSHQRVKLENINLAVENIDKKIEELNKLKANLKQTNDRK
jgi:hypothetical protein